MTTFALLFQYIMILFLHAYDNIDSSLYAIQFLLF